MRSPFVQKVALAIAWLAYSGELAGFAASYYVNDLSTSGDVYSTAPGNDANDGLTPATPKLSLTNLLASYTLAPGDVVYIDTGVYSNYTVSITASGTPTNPIIFVGSTNYAGGGTTFIRNHANADGWTLSGASSVYLRHMTIRGARDGVLIDGGVDVVLERVVVRNNSRYGVYISPNSHRATLRNFIAAFNADRQVYIQWSTNVLIQNSVLWGTRGLQYNGLAGTFLFVSNSVLRASGYGNEIYMRNAPIGANHNVYVLESDAAMASTVWAAFDGIPRLSDWQALSGQDSHSTVLDPLFADPANFDFHPRSQFGRFVAATGSFTNDAVTSPLIDMGARSAPFTNETSPNGGRVNVGAYGNTSEASRSPTNRFLLALRFNDGGVLSGTTGWVTWVAGNAQPADTVRIEYSPDGGATWMIVATNVPATNEMVTWNSTLFPSSGSAKWRVRYEMAGFTNVVSTNNGFFSLRNTNLSFYVNDSSTLGDMFTSAPGSPGGLATSNSPKDSLERVLTNHTISAGDTIYIDAGYYLTTNTIFINYRHRGAAGNPLRLIGAPTNGAVGGPVLDRSNSLHNVITVSSAPYVEFYNLVIRGGNSGILFDNYSDNGRIERCILRDNFTQGVEFKAPNGLLINSLVLNNVQRALTVSATGVTLQNNTIYGSRGIYANPGASMKLENNIVRASGGSAAIFETLQAVSVLPGSDFNIYLPENGAVIGRDWVNTYTRLIDFQKSFNRDWRSTVANPLFADVAAGDFRLRSTSGRWTGSSWTNDPVTSPAIDQGNPASPFANEPAPNGGRVNAGAYGNTPEASRSPTNPWLQALTFADGGTLNVPGDSVYWNFGNMPSGATVRIELSTDSGATWSTVQSGLAATSGVYVWANTNFLSSRFARWRVVYESNTNVFSAITNDIVFRNGPFVYYLNDNSTDGDVFTTAPGSDANLGTSPGAPKYSLKSLVDSHSLEPGDIIYADTGVYTFSIDQTVTSLDAGNTNDFVYLIGSPNDAAGGTVFRRNVPSGYAIHLNGAGYWWIKDISVRLSGTGIRIENAPAVRLERVQASGNSGPGIHVRSSSGVWVFNSASWSNQIGLLLDVGGTVHANHAVLWRNSQDGIRVDNGFATLSNSVIVAHGPFATAYRPQTATNIAANYNNIFLETNALVAVVQADNRWVDSLMGWTLLTGQDAMSLSEDPLFANPGAGDFHLRTEAPQGRFQPGVGFVVDAETSRLIDAGAPNAAFTNEPAPNGGRVDIGMYGNTSEASKSTTNQSLYAASLRQGGAVSGTVTLHWVAYNLPSNHLVTVSYSPDGGESWVTIATGLPATEEAVLWNTTLAPNTPAALWRVRSESNPLLGDETVHYFSIRNQPLSIFVNDATTSGDVYTTAPGAPTNWIASASRPLDSLATVLDRFNLEPGDTVYVDTGNYALSSARFLRRHAGFSNVFVTIRGSTNFGAGGTTLEGPGLHPGTLVLWMADTRGIVLSNLSVRNANAGLLIERCDGIRLEFVQVATHTNGLWLRNASNVIVRHSFIGNNRGWGIVNEGSLGTNRVEYSVIWSNTLFGIDHSSGRMEVESTVLAAFGPESFVYLVQSAGVLRADYNNVLTYDDASVARFGFSVSKTLSRWREMTTNDIRSLSHDPLFANVAGGDFHPRSPAGRYDPISGTFVTTDSVLSPLIDAGPPWADFSLETPPNGARANIGIYGNHPEASRSPTNGWLYTLTLNDGGSTRETNVLHWLAGGAATGALVHVDYSPDGFSWMNIATNVAASAGSVIWITTNYPPSPAAYWRVVVQGNPSIAATNQRPFSVKNEAFAYYVNDASTIGDIYTTAPGHPNNDGLTPGTPVESIQRILERYDLFPGDTIYVDTGLYSLTSAVTLTSARYTGSPTNFLSIIGSTNWAAGGTRINRNNGAIAFSFSGITGLDLRHFIISNAAIGVRLFAGGHSTLEWLEVDGAGTAIELIGCTNTVLRHNLIRNSMTNGLANLQSTGTVWQSGTLWSNRVSFLLGSPVPELVGGPENDVSVSNSIIVSFGPGAFAYWVGHGSLRGNYNNILVTNGAMVARSVPGGFYPRLFESLAQWQAETGQDTFSLSKDPGFVDAEAGNFFLKSQAGRYNPATQTFVTDSETSPLIDAGAPAISYATNEPAPNGNRINIGRYGGSIFASWTPTNPAITLVSWNDGGVVSGVATVRWIARGAATGHVMSLLVSYDEGLTYTTVATNLVASSNQFVWNTVAFSNTPRARLLIINTSVTQTMDRTDRRFSIRNAPFLYYVNDSSTSGDVYTTQAGSPSHTGLSPASPLPSLADVLAKWDLEPGDIVYIDTGVYTSSAPVVINQLDAGSPTGGLPVIIQGSTNYVAGGTRLVGVNTNWHLQLVEASGVQLRHLTLEDPLRPLTLRRVESVDLEFLDIRGGSVAVEIDGSRNIRGVNTVIRDADTAGLRIAGVSNLNWNSGIFWSNRAAVVMASSTNYNTPSVMQQNVVGISNTAFAAFGSDRVVFDARASHTLRSDYNALYRANGASLAVVTTTNSPLPLYLDSLERWAALAGNDRNSLTLDPLFANPVAGDFHLRSQAGRFDPATGSFTNDGITSPLIDAGAPTSAFINEPAPNGGRINIGRFGNTPEASRSPTNSRLHLLQWRDGGVASGPTQLITWVAAGHATGHLLRIDLSLDGGVTWTNISSNVAASAGSLLWNTTNYPSSPAALLRIASQQDPTVADESARFFAVRNAPMVFYVNDTNLVGDVYTTAPGNSSNLGVSAASPMDSLQSLLARWDLAAGDVVYVDTGIYTNNTDILIDQRDAGGFSNAVKVVILGSTNIAAGGTRIIRSSGNGIHLLGAGAVVLKHLRIEGATTGVRMQDVEGLELEWIEVADASSGFVLSNAENVDMSRCVARNCTGVGIWLGNSRQVQWRNGVLWNVGGGVAFQSASRVSFSNSVFGVFVTNAAAFSAVGALPSAFASDYNCFWVQNGALVGFIQDVVPKRSRTVNEWFRRSGQDANSLSADPLFADPAAGDFHLRSAAGRYVPTSGVFVTDTVTSPLIDAGSASDAFALETAPNGGRRNIGLHGNTPFASRTPTNPVLLVASLNDGGRIEGIRDLVWIAQGVATGHMVRLEYTPDDGATWLLIASNISASVRRYAWDTRSYPSSVRGRWRITSHQQPSVTDESDRLFALRNHGLPFFVNDGNPAGDVYCSAPGNPTNLGVSANLPSTSITNIFALWDIEPGDTIYVDAGNYILTAPIVIRTEQAWDDTTNLAALANGLATNRMLIQGSTNPLAQTSFSILGGLNIFQVENAPGVAFRHLILNAGNTGIRFQNSPYAQVEWVFRVGGLSGFVLQNSPNATFRHNSVRGTSFRALDVNSSMDTVWRHGVMWSNAVAFYQDGGTYGESSLHLENSVAAAFGPSALVFFNQSGQITSDYNNWYAADGALVAALKRPFSIVTTLIESVSFWFNETGQDRHSLSVDPLFANPAIDDYHLRSAAPSGRFNAVAGIWTNDTVTSRLIDAGNPLNPVGLEPTPNGGRVDIGLYGSTAEASRTPTNGWLSVLYPNDGGSLRGIVRLTWHAGGAATGHLVRLEWSPVGTLAWTNIASNVPAAIGFFDWDTTNYGRSACGSWRIVSQTSTSIFDVSRGCTSMRDNEGSIPYFVNDAFTNGDVFCSAVGSVTNSGLLPSAPMRSVQDVLNAYRLEPEDIIYVDTGNYMLTAPIRITALDSGSVSNRITLQGSTNWQAGGTVFDRQEPLAQSSALSFDGASGWNVRDIRVKNGRAGISLINSEHVTFERVRAEDNFAAGISLLDSQNIEVRDSIIARNGTVTNGAGISIDKSSLNLRDSVVWANFDAITMDGGSLSATNNSFGAHLPNGRIYGLAIGGSPASIKADYNNYFVRSGAIILQKQNLTGGDLYFQYLHEWSATFTQDVHSLAHDPLYADETNRVFFPRSTAGRPDPSGNIVYDSVDSPLIDTGPPSAPFAQEPMPNGGRVNIGAYANSPLASRSRSSPWLLAVSYNDGGTVKGAVPLRWTSGNITNGSLVRIEYSPNEGAEWFVVASNLLVESEIYWWNASNEYPTAKGKWRVVSQANPSLWDDNDNVFAVKNETLTIYVNDTNLFGDVYATAPGNSTNSGLAANAPLLDPRDAFTRYPLGPGDVIYIDAGEYELTSPLVLNQFTRGISGTPIRVFGSTNPAAPTLLTVTGSVGIGLSITDTTDHEIQHLRFVGGSNVIRIARAERVRLSDVRVTGGYLGISLEMAPQTVLERIAVAGNSGFGISMSVSSPEIINGVFYSNRLGAISASQASFKLYNSIIDAGGSTSALFSLSMASADADFNVYHFPTNGVFARDLQYGFVLPQLSDWQRFSGEDIHSVRIDPLMADPAAGDFSLRSEAGRFASNGNLVFDTNTSWAIDAGRYSDSFANETMPNGGRINAGIFGNTYLASRSPTSLSARAILAASLRDGGTTSGNVPLYWLTRGLNPTSPVRIQVSMDGGATWQTLASNYPAASAPLMWNSVLYGSTPLAFWRICSQENTNICDTVGPFTVRNGPIAYYVNDTNTFGDVYCTAPGSPTNTALSPASPHTNLRDIFERYDLDGGDTIYVDTGIYPLDQPILISSLDSGLATAVVRVVGSDVALAGGSRLVPAPGMTNAAFRFSGAQHVVVDKLVLDGFASGVSFEQQSANNTISNILIRNGGGGASFQLSSGNRISRSIFTRLTGPAINSSVSSLNYLDSSILWDVGTSTVYIANGSIVISNSVLHTGPGGVVYSLGTNGIPIGDFNAYVFDSSATFLSGSGQILDRLPQWCQSTFQDLYSLHVADPGFFNPSNDLFYLRSPSGRYDPFTDSFVTSDTNYSPLIDAGPVEWDYGQEPTPNGTRINIGPHGNTSRASKSRTNAWLRAITAMGGGRLEGLVLLTWNYGNIAATNLVRLDYSYNNGLSWTNIGTATVSQMSFLWQSDEKYPGGIERFPSSPIARWRITLLSDTNVWDMTENYFSLRNKQFIFYVNDSSTVGDIYTCGPGNDANLGIFPCEPKATLASLLADLDVEGEDIILLDTGVYNLGTNEIWTLTIADEGKPNRPVLIRGSTNYAAGGTIIDRPLPGPGALIQISGQYIEIEHIQFRRGGLALNGESVARHLVFSNGWLSIGGENVVAEKSRIVNGSVSASGRDVTVREVTVQHGSISTSGTNIWIVNNLVYGTNTTPGLTLDGDLIHVRNNTVATRGTALRKVGLGSAFVYNNILKADGIDRFCIDAQTGALDSDFNNLWAVNGAWIGGYRNGNWERLHYWQREAQLDLNSISADPLFADEAAGDFRLRSVAGRWTGSTWVNDSVHSPSIDMGSPLSVYTNEPLPNGDRINQGFDGNTPFASKSRTVPWLIALTANDGGVLRGTNILRWSFGNLGTNEQVIVQFSPNNGLTWTNLSGPIAVGVAAYVWDSVPFGNALQARWRVVLVSNTNIYDATDAPFQLRNFGAVFYVNDTNTVGDVYCTAPGNDANSGLSPSAPKRSLQALLDAYDTEGGDVIYIDTGIYPVNTLNRIIWSRGGDPQNGYLLIRGSTNLAAGGTVFIRNSPAFGNNVLDVPASYVEIRDITVQNGYYGIYSSSNRHVILRGIFARSNEVAIGLSLTFNATVQNARVWGNRQGGIDNFGGRTTLVENATFVGNANFAYRMIGTLADVVQNNIFYLSETNSSALSGTLSSIDNAFIDYNVYYFDAPTTSIYGAYTDLLQWQLDKRKDFRSAITNPLLNNIASGDFTLRSQYGRWQNGVFVNDAETSWAIDRGNPASSFTNETFFNGGRINIGAFGNTPFASRSSTNRILELRTLTGTLAINDNSPTNIFPLIWGAINLPTGLIVNVQFSGDGGNSWFTLATNVSAFQEYILWQVTPFFNTHRGRWRVVGVNDTNYWAASAGNLDIFFGQFRITSIDYIGSTNRLVFRGAWNEHYQIQWATNLMGNEFDWKNAVSGTGTHEKAAFLTTNGGDFIFKDIQSPTNRHRLYRVLRLDMEP